MGNDCPYYFDCPKVDYGDISSKNCVDNKWKKCIVYKDQVINDLRTELIEMTKDRDEWKKSYHDLYKSEFG